MAESGLGRQLAAAVQAPMAELAAYLALITRANPRGSAAALLDRPDVAAMLREALSEGHESAMTYIEQGWLASGADPGDPGHARLQADARRIFSSQDHLRDLISAAHASVPPRGFVPGADPPGSNPGREAAERRAAAVADAVTGWARQAAQRARMALSGAEGFGRTAAAIETALLYSAAGQVVRKRWERNPASASCIWCRRLDGVTIGLDESFAPYLGGPAVMPTSRARRVATEAGSARYKLPVGAPIIYTQPPRLYHGGLPGPLLHPFCECKLQIVRAPGGRAVPSGGGQDDQDAGDSPAPEAGGFLAASDIRAMPEDQYRAGLALLRAAVHGMDAAMRGLAEGR